MSATTVSLTHHFFPAENPQHANASKLQVDLAPRFPHVPTIEVYPVVYGQVQWLRPEAWNDGVIRRMVIRRYGKQVLDFPRDSFGYLVVLVADFRLPPEGDPAIVRRDQKENLEDYGITGLLETMRLDAHPQTST